MGTKGLRRVAIAVLVAGALAACSTESSIAPNPSTSTSTTDTTTRPAISATIEGAFGCGPADDRTLTISATGLPDGELEAQLVFDGRVRTRSGPLRGADLEVTLEPDLPAAGYEPGASEVRIVAGSEVIVAAPVQPELPICG